ncbi:MAG TPA: hypothetical protein VK147_09240 [Candidatus Didemnitutus sp.]|nr:hypothetical protein [Candidatus Didemnitutus sp.]
MTVQNVVARNAAVRNAGVQNAGVQNVVVRNVNTQIAIVLRAVVQDVGSLLVDLRKLHRPVFYVVYACAMVCGLVVLHS